jgi:hypothetical protein
VNIMMKEKISESTQGKEEEENLDELFTHWKQELKILEDWFNNPELEKDCQDTVMKGKTVMQIVGEDNSTEFL